MIRTLRKKQNLWVTLHVSVWVEMLWKSRDWRMVFVTLHVSVWVEMSNYLSNISVCSSHAPRERVSWNKTYLQTIIFVLCHAPRERVSWNVRGLKVAQWKMVTLHVSVWVEIRRYYEAWLLRWVTLHVSVWVEIDEFSIDPHTFSGHAPRERVSWNGIDEVLRCIGTSHAPRERVSWNFHIYLWNFVKSVTLHVSVWVEIDRSEQ